MTLNTETSEFIQKLHNAADPKDLLQVIYEKYAEKRQDIDLLAELLADQHNQEFINIVAAFRFLENSPSSKINFFQARSIFEKALPLLQTPIVEVMDCVLHLVKEAGEDLAAETIFKPFINYCSLDSSRPEEGLGCFELDANQYRPLLVPILIAGSQVNLRHYFNLVIQLYGRQDLEIKRYAIFSLSRFRYAIDSVTPQEAFNFVKSIAEQETDDRLLANTIEVAFKLLQQDESLISDVSVLMDSTLNKGGDHSLHKASHLFGLYCKQIPSPIITIILQHLQQVNPSSTHSLRNIDYGLAEILKSDKSEEGIQFLEKLLTINKEKLNLSVFDSTIYQLLNNEENLLGKIIIRWFLSGKRELCRGIVSIFEKINRNTVINILDQEELEYCESMDLLFIARKAIGYLFLQSVSIGSIIISLLGVTKDDQTVEDLSNLLFDPLLISYPGELSQYLKGQLEMQVNHYVKQGIQRALALFESYTEGLKLVENAPELHPSQNHKEVHRRHFSRQMAEAKNKAEKRSVLLNMLHKSIFLYGRKSINYVYNEENEPRRREMHLHSFSTEMEFPHLDVIDPCGLNYMITIFQAEQRVNK